MKLMHKGAYIRQCTDEMAEKLEKEGFAPLEIKDVQAAPQVPSADEKPKAEKKADKKGE